MKKKKSHKQKEKKKGVDEWMKKKESLPEWKRRTRRKKYERKKNAKWEF